MPSSSNELHLPCCRVANVPIALANVSSWRAAESVRNGTRRLLQNPADTFLTDVWTELIPINNFAAAQVLGSLASCGYCWNVAAYDYRAP